MSDNINEDLNVVSNNVDPNVLAAAEKKGLVHVGFGRFEDPTVGQVTHIEQNGKVVPYKNAIRTNTYQNQKSDDFGTFAQMNAQNVDQVHAGLTSHYTPERLSDKELDSLQHFTNLGYSQINDRLGRLPSDIHPAKIEPEAVDDQIPNHVSALDSATKKHRAPFDFITYTKLSADHDLNNYQPGTSFKFKGFRNTSIMPEHVIGTENKRTGATGRKQAAVLQIQVKKNARGIYAHDYSQNPKGDFILPRGAKIHIMSGPHKLVGSDAATGENNLEVVYYNCVHKT